MNDIMPAQIVNTCLEVRIESSSGAVWKALTEEIGSWWPAEFYAGGEPGQRRFRLEAWPGGRMYEEWKEADGLLWATVVSSETDKRLQVTGTTFPEWGGPNVWFGTWLLSEEGGTTLLRFSESILGTISETGLKEKEKGWRFLFEGALKAYVEGRPAPPWA